MYARHPQLAILVLCAHARLVRSLRRKTLPRQDAQRLGIEIDKLRYTVPVQTANGTTYAAQVRLRTLAFGPISLNEVEALVARPNALKENFLGMSFLGRLGSYEFTGDILMLRGEGRMDELKKQTP
jgi:clan AA aspartic protease (TIGR02281 family)